MKGVADVYPLTPSQLGILYDSLRDPDPELYFEQVRFDLVGDVEPAALHRAWTDTFASHTALRTAWLWEGLDDPVQVVRDHVELPWTELDMTSLDDRRAALDALAERDRSEGFDLRRPPASRVTVVRLGDDRHHVIWSFHHIMLDGWSTARVLDEVLDRSVGRAAPTAPPFREHVAWIGMQDRRSADAHWSRLLEGFEQPTVLAGTRAGGHGRFERVRTTMTIDETTTRAVAAAARSERVTVNTLLQAAWALTLSCLSGDDDVVFGVTGSGRPVDVADVESIVGMFLSTLPMRVRIDGDRTVRELWRDLQEQQHDLTQFQYSSLADIARQSSVVPGAPLFGTALVFENFPRPDAAGRPFDIEHYEVFEQARFPLTLMVRAEEELHVIALSDRAQLDDSVVESVFGGIRRVLADMVDDPGRPLRSISLTTDVERDLIAEVNRTDRPVPDATVHDEIAARARSTPDSIALIDGERSLSYAGLDRAARRSGRRLVDHGVAPGDVVLVAVERSIDAVVAMLAVLRAGAAYVPVDPATPVARLRSIVHDARPTLALSSSPGTLAGFAVPTLEVTGIATESTDRSGDDSDTTDVGSGGSPDDTMFVIFTSGSTGRPKGVPGSHRAVLNRCAWEARVAPYESDEVTAQKTTFDFVDHVAELWAPLVAGRSVAIIPDDVVRRPAEFVDALARHGVRRIVMVPSLFGALLEACPDVADRLPELRRWTLSGEPLEPALVDAFRAHLPGATLLNVYGMSEVMADATAFEVTTADSARTDDAGPVPIGRPIDNQRAHVIDRVGRPAHVGVPGEIRISGVGLMPGYWRRDDLTAERVEANPHGDGDHARWYRTGDLGRWSPDGRLEYLGRTDRQVKVRGVRVEPGDVEAAIRTLPGITDAVVVDVAAPGAPARLRAGVVSPRPVDPGETRRRLADLVPAALVPSELLQLDDIPRLPSGKIDRAAVAALPVDGRGDGGRGSTGADAEADAELATMIDLWREVLDVDRIGSDDDYFDVGGHSIAAMRLLARITRTFDVNLELSVLYDAATPRTLTSAVRAARRSADPSGSTRHLVRISTGSSPDRLLYVVHGAGGNVLNFRDLAGALAPDWGLTGIQASGVDGVTPMHRSMDEMCEAYIAELEHDRPDGPLFLAGFSGGGIIAFEIAARLRERGRPVEVLVLLDTFHPTVRGRRRTVGEHARALRQQGPGYLAERRRVRRDRRLYANAVAIVEASREPGQPVPHELRDPLLVANTRSIIDAWTPRRYDGPVRMFAAGEILDVFAHAGPDRGWAAWAPDLTCESVPGGHQDFVVAPHADELADQLRAALDRFVSTGSPA